MLKTRGLAGSFANVRAGAYQRYRRFERLPFWLGGMLGVLIGAGLAAFFVFGLGGPQGLVGFAVLLFAALGLGLKTGWVVDLELPEVPASETEDSEPERVVSEAVIESAPSTLLDMVEIPGGSFLMGSSRDDSSAYKDEFPQHRVTVSPFLMSRFPVTVRDYRTLMEKTPSEWTETETDEKSPANYITWFQAIDFCNALSTHEGFEPCYEIQGEFVKWRRNAEGYRLPTEAEWEYAARAGLSSVYFFGDGASDLGDYAWYSGNSGKKVHPVGELKPNPFGLYDLLGNVWEWCWDWFGDYDNADARNPAGPETGSSRVLRGGSAWNDPRNLRSADRNRRNPEAGNVFIGFRCVRAPAASD
ncbi:MAG: formylglycine-generating enzyme family protein [Gammaproteobacteria bacterium]